MTETANKRLFFALHPDQQTRQGLLQIRDSLEISGGGPNHPQDLHATLAFLGQVTVDQYDCLLEAADRVSGAPFTLRIDRAGYWKRPQILWCGPTETPPELTRLMADLQQELGGCGFTREKRPYRPHVTLSRKSSRPPAAALTLPRPLAWQVDTFVLMETVAGGPSPHYRIRKKWCLGA